MKIEVGKTYSTRGGEHVVRVISLIGKWSKKHPVVGELYELRGKKKIPSEGIFTTYEHWQKDGRYLDSGCESALDLVEPKDERQEEMFK